MTIDQTIAAIIKNFSPADLRSFRVSDSYQAFDNVCAWLEWGQRSGLVPAYNANQIEHVAQRIIDAI